MQAALLLREKQELRKKKLKIRRSRYELPSHVATREIAPFPRFPPTSWGKAAWQDRELGHELERRDSTGVSSDATSSHRFKQKEAHRRWVKRNRIHDTSFGDCSSEDDDLYGPYGVQGAFANALLYVGLGTMCVGMIIAFVGTGEKGFKTMELRLIGPSLIAVGFMIIVLRVMLCVCPSKCLRLNKHKHKHKNSTNKLNSEGPDNRHPSTNPKGCKDPKESPEEVQMSLIKPEEVKKRVSIVTMPAPANSKMGVTSFQSVDSNDISSTISFLEHERGRPPCIAKVPTIRIPNLISTSDEEVDQLGDMGDLRHDLSSLDLSSFGCVTPLGVDQGLRGSDLSIPSLTNGIATSDSTSDLSVNTVKTTTKFDHHRSPKNALGSELVLSPFNLEELCEQE